MLVVEPGDSLKHIQTRKILDALAMAADKEREGSLGSDGETSDYQRSTPSPQDAATRITELGEGLEKADTSSRPPCPLSAASLADGRHRLGEWKSNTSPDLGFVDYVDNPNSIYISSKESNRMPYSDNGLDHARLSPVLPAPSERKKLPGSVKCGNTAPSSKVNPATANILLNKSLKVDLEKLPTVMTSMVTSKNHPSLMFKRSEAASQCNNSRKRPATALGNNQRTGSKKCPRFVASDQRKTSSNKPIPGSKELLLHPNLFNSFRITKPKSNIKCDKAVSKRKEPSGSNGIHFETKKFYKFSDNCNNLAVNKQSDQILPTSVPCSTVFSTKTESNDHGVSSTLNLLDSYSENSEHLDHDEGSHDASLNQTEEDHPLEAVNPTEADNAVFALPNPKKIRFPAVPNSSAIQCKWDGCGECFKTHGALSDHIKTTHIVGVETGSGERPRYACLWVGCKVYGKVSSSLKWLESHVPRHGGKFAYPCIVEGCRMRFSSQAMLERHVNNHFAESSGNTSQTGPRKNIEGATAKKRLKRAGVKLKCRTIPFSARIFDFFDAGIMAGVRHGVSGIQEESAALGIRGDEIQFRSRVISIRREPDGSRAAQVKWIPEDLIPDTWVPLEEVSSTKTVKICNLPSCAKQKLYHGVLGQPVRTKQSRKTKRNNDYNPFLTPAESEARALRHSSSP